MQSDGARPSHHRCGAPQLIWALRRPEERGVKGTGRASIAAIRRSVVALSLLGMGLPAAGNAADVMFDVTPASQEAALGSPITLTFRLRNDGKRDALVNQRFLLNHVVQLEVTTPSGQKDALNGIGKGAALVRGPLEADPIRIVVRGAR